jgi:hypothetical protein
MSQLDEWTKTSAFIRFGTSPPTEDGPWPIGAPVTKKTSDWTHPGYKSNLGKFNVGGSLDIEEKWVNYHFVKPRSINTTFSGSNWQCNTVRFPAELFGMNPTFPTYPTKPTENDMSYWGTAGINRTIPTNPLWNGAQFLGELHMGLPKLPAYQLMFKRDSRAIGGEYLNYEFGIKPVIADGENAFKAFLKAEAKLRELRANSGKHLRRRLTLLQESSTTETSSVQNMYPLAPYWASAANRQSRVSVSTQSERTVWFSGCYSYYWPELDNPLLAKLREIRHTYGLDISPSLAWELSPYSWLIDWHLNIGNVLENMSRFANDGLAMRWGYIMCTQRVTKTYSWDGNYVSLISERKTRRAGNPYGFAMNPSSYSGRQMAILGALGMVKGPKLSL